MRNSLTTQSLVPSKLIQNLDTKEATQLISKPSREDVCLMVLPHELLFLWAMYAYIYGCMNISINYFILARQYHLGALIFKVVKEIKGRICFVEPIGR